MPQLCALGVIELRMEDAIPLCLSLNFKKQNLWAVNQKSITIKKIENPYLLPNYAPVTYFNPSIQPISYCGDAFPTIFGQNHFEKPLLPRKITIMLEFLESDRLEAKKIY